MWGGISYSKKIFVRSAKNEGRELGEGKLGGEIR